LVIGIVAPLFAFREKAKAAPLAPPGGRTAYVALLSNEKYVDGALVLGWSLMETSHCLRVQTCDLVLVLRPEALCPPDVRRLHHVGYTVVPIDRSLGVINDRSPWTDTLDKLHLFNLTAYWKIAYFDVDMLALANPDGIFDYVLPNSSWVAAVSQSSGYFATTAMVLMPDVAVARRIVDFYSDGARNATDPRGFAGPMARDGLVLRYFFGPRFIPLDPAYCAYQNWRSLAGVKVFHWSVAWKPWYHRTGNKTEVDHLPMKMRGRPEFGEAERRWWAAYEAAHRSLRAIDGGPYCDGAPYGGRAGNASVTARTHVWMIRYTKWEYTQPFPK